MKNGLKAVRIKSIFYADFRKSARTLYDELRKDKTHWRGECGRDETYVFVSSTGNQLLFVLGECEVINREGTRYESRQRLLDYRCWRMERSSFHPLMLENYANQVGLSFGRKTLEEWYYDRS